MASEDPKTSKRGAGVKKKRVTLTIPLKCQIIRRLEVGESWSVVMASYSIELSTVYGVKKQKD
jgi:hypothetical protein